MTKRTPFRAIAATAGLTLALGLSACAGSAGGGSSAPADGSTYTLRIASGSPDTGQGSTTIKRWAESIESGSDGRIVVDISWGGERVPASDFLPATQDGRLDGAHLAPVFWPAEMPLSQVLGIPFQTRDPEGQASAFWDMTQESPYQQEWEGVGLEPQFSTPYGTTVIELASAAPETVDDLAGLRIRAVGNMALALSAGGAEPIAMDPGEIYESVDRGVLDGTIFTFDGAPAYSMPEVAPVTVDAGLGFYAATIVAVATSFMDTLPSELREVIEQASAEARENATADLRASVAGHCEYFKEHDAQFVTWDESETERWSELLGDTAVNAWLDTVEDAGGDRTAAAEFRDAYLDAYASYSGEAGITSDVADCAAS